MYSPLHPGEWIAIQVNGVPLGLGNQACTVQGIKERRQGWIGDAVATWHGLTGAVGGGTAVVIDMILGGMP